MFMQGAIRITYIRHIKSCSWGRALLRLGRHEKLFCKSRLKTGLEDK